MYFFDMILHRIDFVRYKNNSLGRLPDNVYLQYAWSYLHGMDSVFCKNHNVGMYPTMYIVDMVLHICTGGILFNIKSVCDPPPTPYDM